MAWSQEPEEAGQKGPPTLEEGPSGLGVLQAILDRCRRISQQGLAMHVRSVRFFIALALDREDGSVEEGGRGRGRGRNMTSTRGG